MNKKEAYQEFKSLYPLDSFIRYENVGDRKYIDKPMRDQAWNDFTDSLCKEGRITLKQYESWTHPWY